MGAAVQQLGEWCSPCCFAVQGELSVWWSEDGGCCPLQKLQELSCGDGAARRGLLHREKVPCGLLFAGAAGAVQVVGEVLPGVDELLSSFCELLSSSFLLQAYFC